MPKLTDAALLRRAATVLKKRGLAKNELEDRQGRVCLLGALNIAVGIEANSYHDKAIALARRVAKHLGFSSEWDAVDWNNERKRKITDVLDALRGAARAAAR